MRTVQDIIELCGGRDAIANEAAAREQALSAWAVKKWPRNGIPEKHWELIRALSGVSVETIYEANNALRTASEGTAA